MAPGVWIAVSLFLLAPYPRGMSPAPSPRLPLPSFHDLTRGLVWPGLLRAGGMALRPAHVGLAFFLVVLVILLSRVPDLWMSTASDGTPILNRPSVQVDRALGEAVGALREARVGAAARKLIALPGELVRAHPLVMAIMLVPLAMLWGVFGGAIARSAQWQVARGERMGWTDAFGFALAKMVSLTAALAGPFLFVGVVFGLVALAGRFFFARQPADWMAGAIVVAAAVGIAILQGALSKRVRAGRIIAAAVIGVVIAGVLVLPQAWAGPIGGGAYGLLLIVTIGALLLLAMTVVGLPMLSASVMAEGNDAIEAVQRVWAYVVHSPLRLVAYLIVLGLQGAILVGVVGVLVLGGLEVCAHLATALAKGSGIGDLRQFAMFGERPMAANLDGWQETTGKLMGWWAKVAMLMVVAVIVSFVHAGGALLYLAMRRVCDGQDQTDVWDPRASTRVGAARIDDSETGEE